MDCGSAFAEVGMKEVAINANQFYSGNIWVPRTLSPMLNSDGKPPEMNHQATIGWTWNYHEYLCWVINPSVIVTTSICNWNSTSMNETNFLRLPSSFSYHFLQICISIPISHRSFRSLQKRSAPVANFSLLLKHPFWAKLSFQTYGSN